MNKIFFTISTLIGGYLGFVFSSSVSYPSLGLTIFGILFCALIMACVAASFLDGLSGPTDNRPLFRRLAPLAFFYWLTKNKG